MAKPHVSPPARAFVPDLCEARAVLVVVVVAQLMAIVLALSGTYYNHFSFERLALTSFFMQWVGLTSAAALCALRVWLNRLPPAWAATGVVVLVVSNTLVFSLLARMVMRWALPEMIGGVSASLKDVWINVTIAAILAGGVMRYFYVQDQLRIKEQAELEARIQALQSRIRPHFLFNSMNIISSLIAVDPAAAEQAVEDLARLFRASLRETGLQVSLKEELDLCRRYARIEQQRMGDRLKLDWQVQIDPERALIPLLTLQPLLENAIYHGIQSRPDGGTVTVRVDQDGDMLRISMTNPLPAEPAGASQGNRMALENIRHRLAALYGDRARVEAAANNNEYRVSLRYPRA